MADVCEWWNARTLLQLVIYLQVFDDGSIRNIATEISSGMIVLLMLLLLYSITGVTFSAENPIDLRNILASLPTDRSKNQFIRLTDKDFSKKLIHRSDKRWHGPDES